MIPFALGASLSSSTIADVRLFSVRLSGRWRGARLCASGELEGISEKMHNGYFVDLFVRKSNSNAITMYKGLGYTAGEVTHQCTPFL